MTALINKALTYVLAALMLVGVGGAVVYHYAEKHTAELEAKLAESEKLLKASSAASTAKAKAVSAIDKANTKRTEEVQNALKANPDWSSERVPDAVFDSLFGSADAPNAVPE